MSRNPIIIFLLIAILYLLLGWQYAIHTPDWQVPDEPAHYNYIRQLAAGDGFPVIEDGDWDTEYQNLLISTGFDPQHTAEISRIEYEDHQPPLYYLAATPVYEAFDGDLTALRLFSVILGLAVVVGVYATARVVFPDEPTVALIASALVAFIPQQLSILSGVTNDGLAQVVAVWTFFAVAWFLMHDQRLLWQSLGLGVLVGLAFLTKSTIYFLAGIAGLALLIKWWRLRWDWQTALQHIGAFLIPALVLGGLWWIRNLDVYGGTDFLGLQRHDEVAADQLQTDDYIEWVLDGDTGRYYRNMTYTTFHSFWGQFGWMAVPMEIRIYRLLLVMCVGLLVGSLLYGWRQSISPRQWDFLRLGLLSMGFVLAAFLLYNRQFVQFQGRYLFPALLPLGMLFGLGVIGWLQFIPRRDLRLMLWSAGGFALLMAGFAYYALQTYVVDVLPMWN